MRVTQDWFPVTIGMTVKKTPRVILDRLPVTTGKSKETMRIIPDQLPLTIGETVKKITRVTLDLSRVIIIIIIR